MKQAQVFGRSRAMKVRCVELKLRDGIQWYFEWQGNERATVGVIKA